MIYRPFGRSDFEVSALGFGAGHIGGDDLGEQAAGQLLNEVVDRGITLIDTARGYGLSEERIGRHLAWRRKDFILSTKGGYGVEGVPDWTPENIRWGVERALETLNTDYLDIFHLHSCPLETLQNEELLGALQQVKAAGQVRAIAYSGENEALRWATHCGVFDSVQCSVNPFEQRVLPQLRRAAEGGLGVIAKRPLANVPWRYAEQPRGEYAEAYWLRMRAMDYAPPLPWTEFALRFSAFAEGVSSAIVGSRNLVNIEANIELLSRGPLPEALRREVEAAFQAHDQGWEGQV
ncbi:aldo/keto reductase [Deinococcus irradiatisoli]|uniref:Aldo/keto reductase n=1 Tax=Deinococcus irradiatisoli TaxID=2202254 RepID=A0A2Z3JI92_9DEIO|nr:aldo/keto reductase [Deinococcus irradiatisoli]AWN23321.1 aldo/keto reductase [Deinococcus irradiatisoli]